MSRSYKQLRIYQQAYEILLEIYDILRLIPKEEENNIKTQLQRAATSIVLNIAEGSAMKSNKVFLNHLQYSYGSAQEVEVILKISYDLKYIEKEIYEIITNKLEQLKGSLYKFTKRVDEEIKQRKNNYEYNR